MVFLKTDQGTYLELPIPSAFSIGRGSSADIKPESKSVSKRHGQLTIEKNAKTGKTEAWIEDLNSTFGTFVGETPATVEKISEKTRLFFGFYVRFGHAPTCFQYLEFKDEDVDGDTTDAQSAQVMPPQQKRRPPPIQITQEKSRKEPAQAAPTSASPKSKQLTDEEYAIHLQFGGQESPERPRAKALIQHYESKLRTASTSPQSFKDMHISRKTNLSASLDRGPESPTGGFGAESSFRDMAQDSSFSMGKPDQPVSMKLPHPADSFSEPWEESRSVQPTPTFCQPPAKPQRDNSSTSFASDLDEKPDFEDPPWDESQTLRSRSTSALSPRPVPSAAPTPRSAGSSAGIAAAGTGGTIAAPPASATSPRANPSGGTIAAPPAGQRAASPRGLPNPSTAAQSSSPRPASLQPSAAYDPEHELLVRAQNITHARHAFRMQKAATMPEATVLFNTYHAVARQWRKAALSLDSVPGGFCISVVLPFLDTVKVKPAGKELHKVRIDAHRWVDENDTCATDADKEYLAEFKLRGLTSEIRDSDLSYDYDHVTGLLCVFINRLRLKHEQLLVKTRGLPLVSKPKYVKAKTMEELEEGANATKPPLTMRSLFAWIPGLKEREQKQHEEAAKTYKKVLSRKSSMLDEANAAQGASAAPAQGGGRAGGKVLEPSAPPAGEVQI